MYPFSYQRADRIEAAVRAVPGRRDQPPTQAEAQFLAGGTTLLDLMKLGSMQPRLLIDVNGLRERHAGVRIDKDGLWLGAFTSMAEAAGHPEVLREYPVIAQSLQLAASAQLRNMATLGGNVLQRTRCQYFRDPSWSACNKRTPGSGCAALQGVNRKHAVLGTSEHCIATYPGDFAQALVALDAMVEIHGADGVRRIRFEDLHREPGDTPQRETQLASGELISAFTVPAGPWTRRSRYLKVRDRASYEFGLATAAVALELDLEPTGRQREAGEASADDVPPVVRQARIALGGIATRPWRARAAEAVLQGHPLSEARARAAADAALRGAVTHGGNDYKPLLARRTLVRALLETAALDPGLDTPQSRKGA